MTDTPKRQCYAVFAGQWNPDMGYIPSVVTEGEAGHSPLIGRGELSSPWYWSRTLEDAQRICDYHNAKDFHLTTEEAKEIIASSITASIREDASRERSTERYDKALGRPPRFRQQR